MINKGVTELKERPTIVDNVELNEWGENAREYFKDEHYEQVKKFKDLSLFFGKIFTSPMNKSLSILLEIGKEVEASFPPADTSRENHAESFIKSLQDRQNRLEKSLKAVEVSFNLMNGFFGSESPISLREYEKIIEVLKSEGQKNRTLIQQVTN
jgi:hypothetical protein